eukprot:TRINITY_DN95582_c0_g1_i1.p1 TRINITY_DN95582_c0_g1~~TRINITY_DN95582_c0_g1_i1.p1  ORF type:complete len:501 (+),score=70.78 TRINITY_DN95582_c0_g1_i1:67-1569(+)
MPAPSPRSGSSQNGNGKTAYGYMHVVDWSTVHRIRAQVREQAFLDGGEEALVVEGGPQASSEELARCWLKLVKAQHDENGTGSSVTERDKEFVRIRVMQTMREVDPQGTGRVGIDVWCNHMLLTRSSPAAMRAMLHINRLLEGALTSCPSILVALQHSFEVAEGCLDDWPFRDRASGSRSRPEEQPPGIVDGYVDIDAVVEEVNDRKDPEVAPEATPEVAAKTVLDEEQLVGGRRSLPVEDIVGMFCRKLWHLRPIPKEGSTKRRTDFSYASPVEFVQETLAALELDGSRHISSSDFLALCLGRQEWPVTLHLYDLSRGMATMLGPMLLSKQLEGIWHTGIVVFGKEYYFGGDIFYDTPANTGFGTPRVVIQLGSTLRQRDELHAYIVDELKPIFNREAYDAARNNCNHFTDKVSMYLVGRHIPEEVLDQPQLMLDTSLGRALRPLLNRVLGRQFEPKSSSQEISTLVLSDGTISLDGDKPLAGSHVPESEAIWGQTLRL